MIRLKGTMTCTADRLAEVRAALQAHVALTRDEPGCIRFEVTEDAAMPGLFHVDEAFSDRAAFEAHQARGAASVWAEVTLGLPRAYEITETEG
ncbi:putative quinol monooxygenase [Tropicibacter sp. S64]|uniref:putative quinol monooxygenase n=1 Tax=Tropicibacter sp. S64 TaxID=3415122 RepID=UPI003C7C126D